jgi:hypothetical protein
MDTPVVPVRRWAWARDFAIVGGTTSIMAPAMAGMTEGPYLAAAGTAGAVTGFGVGLALAALQPRLRRLPLLALIALAVAGGVVWGGAVGFAAGTVFIHDRYVGPLWTMSMVCAAIAGGLQLGWFYAPYAVTAARGRSTANLVLAACAYGCVVGVAALYLALGF